MGRDPVRREAVEAPGCGARAILVERADNEKVAEMTACIREVNPSARVVQTVFRPKPLQDIRQETVLFTTTAPAAAAKPLVETLEREFGCEVVAVSHHLSNRPRLREDIAEAVRRYKPSVLLTELKAAAVDVRSGLHTNSGLSTMPPPRVGAC